MIAHLFILLIAAGKPGQTPEEIFKSAIEDFEFGEHASAAEKLRKILEPPQLKSKEDLIVARQYLGACYHLLDDKTKAKSQFSMLLVFDPKHKLDPEVFSPALVEFFEEVRRETGIQLERGSDPPPREKPPKEKPPKEASSGEVKTDVPVQPAKPPPAALALIPFGVGQFSNKHPIRGVAFAVTEIGLYTAAIATFAMFEGLKLPSSECPGSAACFRPEDESNASSLQTAYLVTFWSAIGVTALGIVEALISYPGDSVPAVASTPAITLSPTGFALSF